MNKINFNNMFSASVYEAYIKLYEKMNELINQSNELVTDTDKKLELMKQILDDGIEGIPAEIIKQLYEMIENGTIEKIINVNIFNNLNSQIKEIEKRVYDRKFKPMFLQNIWSRNELDTDGLYTISFDKVLTEKAIKDYKYAGVDGLTFVIHIGYDKNKNKLYSQCNFDTLDFIIEKSLENGLKLSFFKFHQVFAIEDIFAIGENSFKQQYKNIISQYLERYKDYFEYVGLFNEWRHFYMDNGFVYNGTIYDYTDYVIECLNIAKSYGYKASVSLAGVDASVWSSFDELSEKVINNIDVFMVNYYQPMGCKFEKTSLKDCITAHKNSTLYNIVDYLTNNYNKKVIITETGLNDYWSSLYAPPNWLLNGERSNGFAPVLYTNSLFECFNNENILSINYWFTDPLLDYKEKFKELNNRYLGGRENE